MSDHQLEGCRILVVEDEYLIADDMRGALLDAGAEVLGPVPTVDAAMSLVAASPGWTRRCSTSISAAPWCSI